ncbi:actin-related protein ARP1 [Toxoplasma gondii TgCatPRC2]|uniref:Actin, putative n=18 Tax=Toxoplasma gondii TaxID=5811 RepID=B9PQT4_TOXGV|nr:actin-related protein ARP1 [Toxoplasma gondii ME49]EPR63540.1 actin-related protein ARP1 [Toxoplasma gondii GT1]ESS34265.1 actin-related protein ARP1 [Toxoplasma gondii VEG]KAF4638642.1 actin-related protein ARP1 [Toxoplasma gondii]KFG46519.1 actin-related protein ARP1 [Toxoplasma gondii GAB2-2007-GAL-DOM2]KFG48448.1 actin-related protein ARP1 [Toxoplasma gondii p89]KYF49743.1 actin-related protein ARP1 [Toxoplasma gondii ARI]KYK68162.1 actin-related protein ARP1 [Toxoplasma gondii TgCatP|eukprot:XP_002367209.1 actin-related protein ARP1 [Toxoplasma gondii ME49]
MLKSGGGFEEVIANQPLVIDNGTGVVKAGFAGEDTPKCVFPAFVGRPKFQRVMAGAIEGDVFVGTKAEQLRGLLKLSYPMCHGMVDDWLDMELVWTQVFSEMKINSEEHPVLLTESALNPRKQREKAAEIFFETFNSPAMFVSAQPILALYSSGRTTGVVLDSGDGVTHAVPVYEGFSLSHAIMRSDVAGRDITDYLALLLRRAGHIFHTSAEMDVVRTIKESACYIAFNPQKEDAQGFDKAGGGYPFQLPDGVQIQIASERYRAPEILFHPSLIGLEYAGMHELLVTSVSRCDLDLRRMLYSQIVLAGGSTMFHGFGDRLLNEVRKLAPKDIKIRISAPPERKYSTWIGGSILASLATFKKMWVSKQEYEEYGAGILHRKTL